MAPNNRKIIKKLEKVANLAKVLIHLTQVGKKVSF
jgi:hypothetical protein